MKESSYIQVVCKEELNWNKTSSLQTYLEVDRAAKMDIGDALVRFASVDGSAGAGQHFVCTMHHTLYDGHPHALMMKAFYDAYMSNTIAAGPAFSNFLQHICQRDEDKTRQYWTSELDGFAADPFPTLPKCIQVPVSNRTTHHRFNYRVGQDRDITLANTIRAAWAFDSGQMVNSDESIFGVTLSGRNVPVSGIEHIAGPTFTTVPVRIRWTRHMRASDFLHQVQTQATEMINFEQTGLQNIASISKGCSRACEYQTLMIVRSKSEDKHTKGGYELLGNIMVDDSQQRWLNPYALMLEINIDESTIDLKAMFDSRVIDEWTLSRLVNRFSHVCQQLLNSGREQTLDEIDLVSPMDLQEIWSWNKQCPVVRETNVQDLITTTARAQSSAPAVDAWDGHLSYGELDSLSETLAKRLISSGVGQNSVVRLCFEKSMWTSVAILGVLKPGGAFTLLTPSLPEQRLRSIVLRTQSTVILSSTHSQELSARLCPNVVVVNHSTITPLDSASIKSTQTTASVPASAALCVVFTSGSTGKPKGNILTHANFASAMYHQREVCDAYKGGARVYDFASYAFDIAVHNVLMTFAQGGCLCIPSEEQRRESLMQSMAELEVTTANITPSVARLLDPESLPTLTTLILAGVPVSSFGITRWKNRRESIRIINAYGPAECGISSLAFCEEVNETHAAPIGKGAGLVTWVVDAADEQKLVGVGCTGELLLDGPLVGAGYLETLSGQVNYF